MVISENIDNCLHKNQITDFVKGDIICEDCGLVVNRCFVDSTYEIVKNNCDFQRKSYTQYVEVGNRINYVNGLGSCIDNVFFDYKRKLLSLKKQILFKKLKKYNFNTSIRGKITEHTTLRKFNQISDLFLHLSQKIKDKTCYLYRKIRKKIKRIEFFNNINLMAACLYISLREFSFPMYIKKIVKVFREFNCRVSVRSLLKTVMVIKSNFPNFFPKIKHFRSEDYIPLLVNQIIEDCTVKKKLSYNTKTQIQLKTELLKYTNGILDKISVEKRGSMNTYLLAIGAIYASVLIVRDNWNFNRYFLSLPRLSQIFDVSKHSIRDKWNFIKDCLNMQ